MMKFFTNKKIWEKIILALLFVMLFQFAVMKPVEADVVEFGGKLLSPVMSLLVSLGDGVINILHSTIVGVDTPLIHVDTDDSIWTMVLKFAAAVITVACVLGAFVATGGLALILGGVAFVSISSQMMGGNVVFDNLKNGFNAVASWIGAEGIPDDIYLPAYTYSPEEIFKGNILLFNVNFFREPIEIKAMTHTNEDTGEEVVDYWYYLDENGDVDIDGDGINDAVKTSSQDSAEILQSTVSTWYNAIRNIALVVMLSVLVYIGIRILLSSVASDRAKYITMLKDWFIGLCLLFLMHYIMAFSVTLVDKITDIVSTSVSKDSYQVILQDDDDQTNLKEVFGEDGLNLLDNDNYVADIDEDGKNEYIWTSNLMGYLRLKLQMDTPGGQYIGEGICFLVLVVFTVMFTFTYLRRLLYMAFLTLIAPLVALTYCIDKLNDGTAQGFNRWFKEYIFNLLIQPMHLLLYYILVTSAFTTLGDNVVYSIVAIGFMLPAEKLLRSLFGFEKASTPSMLGGAAATSLMMTGSGKITGMFGKHPKGNNGGSSTKSLSSSEDESKQPLRTNEVDSTKAMLGEGFDGNVGNENEDDGSIAALEKYKSEGGNQNADGEYYNPWTDEYDADYDPTKDQAYNANIREANIPEIDTSQNVVQENGETDQSTSPTRMDRFKRSAGRRLGALGSAGLVLAKRKLKATPRVLKGVALGAAVGSAAAMAGTVAVVTAGDPGKVGTALSVGAGGGYLAGRTASNSKMSDFISPEVKQAYERKYNSPEYKEEQMKEYIKKMKKDQDVREKMQIAFKDKSKVEEMMSEGGNYEKFLRNGVNDVDDIIAAQKLIDNKKLNVNSVDKATAIVQYDKRMERKDPTKMIGDKRKKWESTFKDEYMKAGLTDEKKALRTAQDTMNLVHEFHKAKE